MKRFHFFVFAFLLFLFSCKHKPRPAISFYYWKTHWYLSQNASDVLQGHQVKTLYIRYFDVDKEPGDTAVKPVAPISISDTLKDCQMVPVIYIRNRVFENVDSQRMAVMANNIFQLQAQINAASHINSSEVQFDCDWTERTKESYFLFLRQYQTISKQAISATIRLHQVKYHRQSGIPPVNRGVLMYYNMGEINAGNKNSVYDNAIAAKYLPYLSGYPLPLDIALPVFAWGQQVRDGQVIGLLNKINEGHFIGDSNFISLHKNRLQVKHSCFKAGYYFKEKDEIKIEAVSAENLLQMSADINKYVKEMPRQIIFYDLDSINIARYETNMYQKIVDGFN